MKKTNLHILFIAFLFAISNNSIFAQEKYEFNHGPYLQGLTETEVSVFFTSSKKGFSLVELREAGKTNTTKHYTYINGLIEANNTMNAIKLDNLTENTKYEYRLISKEITDFQPYKVTFGDSIISKWYEFKTLDSKTESCSFIVTSDIHDDSAKYSKLLSYFPVEKTDMIFLLGDIMNYFHKPDQPYTSFIDVSVNKFATGKPFAIVRGNHETRGCLARGYGNFIYRPNGVYYELYKIGNTAIIMLDSGEDKPDNHPVYAGITSFDEYRQEQAEWLKETVKTKEYKKSKHKIVMVHIPPAVSLSENEIDYGAKQVNELFMPILNKANVDLMVSGHTHKFYMIEKERGMNNFPIMINDNKSASYISVNNEGIHVKTVNTEGEITFERTF